MQAGSPQAAAASASSAMCAPATLDAEREFERRATREVEQGFSTNLKSSISAPNLGAICYPEIGHAGGMKDRFRIHAFEKQQQKRCGTASSMRNKCFRGKHGGESGDLRQQQSDDAGSSSQGSSQVSALARGRFRVVDGFAAACQFPCARQHTLLTMLPVPASLCHCHLHRHLHRSLPLRRMAAAKSRRSRFLPRAGARVSC